MADYGSLEGGWGHVASDPLAFIQELLTPRNVQGRTDFAGGSHFGPGREMSIPQQNFAQAANLLKILSERDQYQRGSEISGQADDLMRRRLEAERTNLSPGSITMGGVTEVVPGKMGVQTDLTPTEVAMTEAGGYADTRYPPKGYGSSSSGSSTGGENFKNLEAKAAAHYDRGQELRDKISMLDPDDPMVPELTAEMTREFAAYEAIAFPETGGPSEPRTRKFGEPNINDLNGDGGVTAEEAYGPGGKPPARPSSVAPASSQGGDSYQAVSSPPAPMTAGQRWGEAETASQDPITDTNPGRVDERYQVGNFIASIWNSLRPPDKEKVFRQGYDPETGDFIMPDNPLWARVSPEAQKRILSRMDAGNDTRQASLGALGYPAYEPGG